MQRKSTVALCVLAVTILLACSRNGPPSSLFEAAGYHVRDGKVYYLNAFPGNAFEINGADAATFLALDSTYGRDTSNVYVYVNGHSSPVPTLRHFRCCAAPTHATIAGSTTSPTRSSTRT